MKIHYKTLILNKEGEEELLVKQVLEKNKQYVIDYCCEKMKAAIEDKAFNFNINGIDLFFRALEYNGPEDFIYPLEYCPFCGEKIEPVEEYRAKLEYHKVRIPKKTIEAYYIDQPREIKL